MQRRQFLDNALKSLTVDVVEQLQKAVETIMDKNASSEDILDALDLVGEYIDNIDFAIDFCKLGGLKVILPHLRSKDLDIVSNSCDLLAEICQNNPFCQNQILELEVLPELIKLLGENETLNVKVASSSMHAISCVVRGNRETLNAFIAIHGVQFIMQAIKSQNERLSNKALFLLNSLCSEYSDVKSKINYCNYITCNNNLILFAVAFKDLKPELEIIELLKPSAEYNTKDELLITALDTLIDKTEDLDFDVQMKLYKTLRSIEDYAKDKTELLEILEHSQNILKRCFPNGTPIEKDDDVER